jgi:hypothetical protein
MLRVGRLLALFPLVLGIVPPLPAELPLPDTTLFGQITTEAGAPVSTGALKARILRGAATVIEVPGSFHNEAGIFWYAVRIPMETAIGAPGPSGVGARESDTLGALLLNGAALTLKAAAPALKAGSATRLDATAPPGLGDLRYVRGDCNGDRVLEIGDVLKSLFFLFVAPIAPPCLEACDSDGSGAVQIPDAIFLLTHLFLGQAAPPAPGIGCNVDPSPSALGCVQSPCPAGG